MKKFLVGCLVILVLAGVVLTVGGYFLYQAASPLIQNARNRVDDLVALNALEKEIANRAPHTPPASNELSEAQVQRFARVQDHVHKALGQRMTDIEEKYRHLKANAETTKRPSVGEMLNALGDIASTFVQARRYQVDALNREGFSQAEYSWVRDRVFQAAGTEAINMVDLRELAAEAREKTGIEHLEAPEMPKIDVPEKNRALVKPYLDRMDRWIPLVFFGL